MRRRRFNKKDNTTNDMIFAEFLFYNKSQKLIDDEIVENIRKNLIEDDQEYYWTDKFYAIAGIGFKFYTKNIAKVGEPLKIEIYVEMLNFHTNIDADKFMSTKSMIKNIVLTFDITPDQEALIKELNFYDYNYTNLFTETGLVYCGSWEELIDIFIVKGFMERLRDTNTYETFINRNKILLNYETKNDKEIMDKIEHYKTGGYGNWDDLFYIIDVVEKRINNVNYRIALLLKLNRYNCEYRYKIFLENNKYYNYIDESRIYFRKSSDCFFMDFGTKEINGNGQIIINENILNVIANNIYELLPKGEFIITPKIYNFFKSRESKFKDNRSYDKKNIDEITLKYVELLEKDKTIKIQNLFISNKEIYSEDGTFHIVFGKGFMDVTNKISNIRDALKTLNTQYDVNSFYDSILKMSALKVLDRDNIREDTYKNFPGLEYKINGLKVKIHKEGNRLHINGVFCRIDDIYYMLSRAICYNTDKDYVKYLEDVSHIGAEWLHMISQGIEIQLTNPFMDVFKKSGMLVSGTNKIRFSLLWDVDKKNKVYIVVNGHKHLIKYKQKFKQEYYKPSTYTSLTELKKHLSESLESIDDDLVVTIVGDALKESVIVQSRGIELVNSTIEGVKAVSCILDIGTTNLDGYKLIGRLSGSQYFIHKQSLDVYKFMDGSWNRRCVVDDHSKQRIYEDKLANRLINIYNEPIKIHTIHK